MDKSEQWIEGVRRAIARGIVKYKAPANCPTEGEEKIRKEEEKNALYKTAPSSSVALAAL
jgi:hypothetical protein